MDATISVIVPVYQAEAYLENCIESLLAQSHRQLELILVDDGSPDGCGVICDRYAACDARVRVIHQRNAGVSAARNAGLDAAQGAFIAFCDADDWVESDWLAALYWPFTALDAPSLSVCAWYREEPWRQIDCSAQVPEGCLSGEEAFCCAVRGGGIEGYLFNKLFPRETIGALRLRPEIHVCEDLLLVCQILARCRRVECVQRPLYHYRIHAGSMAHNVRARLDGEMLARQEILSLAPERCCREAAVFSYVQQGWLNVLRARRAGDRAAEVRLRAVIRPHVRAALLSGGISPGERLRLAVKLLFPGLISEKYM